MKRKLVLALSNSSLIKKFIKSPTPHWLVLIADLAIATLSTMIVLLCSNLGSSVVFDSHMIVLNTLIFIAVYFVAFLLTKPYKSIVRLSTINDTWRILLSVILASTVLTLSEVVVRLITHDSWVGFWNIFVVGIMAFSSMTMVRLLIKYIYQAMTTVDTQRRRVIVLGSAINSFALAAALEAETDGQFSPVCLLSLSHKSIRSSVNGIPIRVYDPDTVVDIFKQYKCDTLLFLSTQIEFIRSGAADVFLSNHIKLLMLNQVEEFVITSGSTANISPHIQNIKIEDLLGREPIFTDNPNIACNIVNQTIMVTGAAGSIGSEIVRQVARFKAKCIVLVDQAETPMHEMQLEMKELFPDAHIEMCVADVSNHHRMSMIFEEFRPRMVFHAAAYKHVPMMENNPSEAIITNVFGTKTVADLSLKYGVDRFVMISTDKAVNPTNIMGASKRIAEIYVQSLAYNLYRNDDRRSTRFITTRFGNVLGSNGSVIPLFRKQISNGGPVTVTHRDIIRYFMTIPEACTLVLEAGCMGMGGEIFIFDMGKPIRIYDLAKRMISLSGLRPNVDINIVETGLRPGEKLFEELLNDHERVLPTHHKKIMRAKVRIYDYSEVCSRLEVLHQFAEQGDNHDIVVQMKRIVPEYKSQNSQWAQVDQEVTADQQMTEIILPS